MIKLLRDKDINNFTVYEMKEILQKTGGYYCLKNKEEYVDRIQNFKNVLNFSWRSDQKDIIDEFLKLRIKLILSSYFDLSLSNKNKFKKLRFNSAVK